MRIILKSQLADTVLFSHFGSFYFGECRIHIYFYKRMYIISPVEDEHSNVGRLKLRRSSSSSSRRKVAGFGARYWTPRCWWASRHLFRKCVTVHVKQFEHSVDWRSITESIYILIGLYFKSRNSLTLTSERVAEIITLRTRLLLCLMDWGVNDFCPACAYIHPGLICDREYSDTNHIFPGGPWHHVLPLQTSLRVKVSFICEQPVQRCRKSGVFMSRAAECWTAEVCGWLRALRCEYKAGGCWERERESAGSLRPPRINNETRRAGRAAPCILVVCYKLL